MNEDKPNIETIRDFYDNTYYANTTSSSTPSRHLKNLASVVALGSDSKVLDVACGTGEWLRVLYNLKNEVSGIDISERATEICKSAMPSGDFRCQDAQKIPYPDNHFDLVSCLGSLEHFPDKHAATAEMCRVTRPGGKLLILVPNSNFLGIKLGLFKGTQQKDVLETPLSLAQWRQLFADSGLKVSSSWKDLHVLSRDWIMQNGLLKAPLRLAAAIALAILPDSLQYQNYFLCTPEKKV